ncbi:MAG: hypothetical protein IJ790_01390 [Lachnospiraceae bacterium]|nr:hypothetical protein [Lachnospiraceae bacterium]
MKNAVRKILSIFISLILISDVFAVAVSDNDGAAFITKSEFDSLKAEFQNTLNSFNYGIDSKIDNAIASYLAGAKASKTYKITTNIDTFNYPITIIDKRKIIEECPTSSTDLMQQATLWAPGYYFVASARRDGREVSQQFKWDCIDNLKIYLNGTANTSAGTFKVLNLFCNPERSFSTAFHHENLNATSQAYTSVFLDQSSIWASGAYYAMPVTRPNIRAEYALNTKINDYEPVFQGVHHPNGLLSFPLNGKARCDRINGSASGQPCWDSRAAGPFECSTMLTKGDYTYSNEKLNVVYNYGVSANNSHFAPVAYNNDLYITNKQACRTWYSSKTKEVWEGRGTSTSNTGVQLIFTEGINLEHEAEDTSRVWYKKSLISQNRLVYDVVTTDNDVVKANHRMVQGIPVFYLGNSTAKAKDIYVEFTINTSRPTNAKYAILSTEPITTQVYSDNVEGNSNYCKIVNLNGVANDTRKVRLVNGQNILKISEMAANKVLYLKILWNDNNVVSSAYDESITMSKPNITYTEN